MQQVRQSEEAIEWQRAALLRVLLGLFALAGIAPDAKPETFRLMSGLRRALMRLVRVCESATRRLVYVTALALDAAEATPLQAAPVQAAPSTAQPRPGSRGPAGSAGFALLDPRIKPGLVPQRFVTGYGPQISVPGVFDPPRPPVNVGSSGPIESRHLVQRMNALKAVLEDMARPAKRMAAWLAKPVSVRRFFSPLRPGFGPGARKKPLHEVDELLSACHQLALRAQIAR